MSRWLIRAVALGAMALALTGCPEESDTNTSDTDATSATDTPTSPTDVVAADTTLPPTDVVAADTPCTPQCAGKQCGSDGCGGSCGNCAPTETCNAASQCEAGCTADCTGKACGTDGCGGSCGDCAADEVCNPLGACIAACTPDCTGKSCGDDTCGGSCGDCGNGESCDGAGQCIPDCVPSCDGKACGDDGCNGICGLCAGGLSCSAGACVCVPSCEGKTCGDNGCGGSCGDCAGGEICDGTDNCLACTPACDGKACGDDGCGGVCGLCEVGNACNATGQCEACTADCDGKACGDDSCGGSCGDCADGEACDAAGQCAACTPACEGLNCGDDGCGGVCGDCGDSEACVAGVCAAVCNPACDGKACGDNGCGGQCGTCAANETCNDSGQCDCVPACDGKVCGDDGCGGSCGDCGDGDACGDDGQCVACTPACDGKVCGDNGCDGSCGECGDDEACTDSGQCEVVNNCIEAQVVGQLAAVQPGIFQMLIAPIGGEANDALGLEFYSNATGSFGLGVGMNANYATCEQCVRVFEDIPAEGAPARQYLATAGTIDIDATTPPQDVAELLIATLTDVTLSEVTISEDGSFTSTLVPDGACVTITGPVVLDTTQCVANCTGKVCGDDGCGGSCGDCTNGDVCSDAGQCEACTPACDGKVCGDDACGGSCGDCGDGMACDPAGQCIAESTCTQVMAVAGTLTGANPYQVDLMPIGGADQDVVQLEFYADDTGAFDLAAGLNANYATCNQCVRVFEDVFPDQSDVARQYFQSEGTLTIDASSAPQTGGTVTATLDGVKLVEVTVAGDFTSTPVVDGGCIEFVDGTVLSTEAACVPDCTGKVCGSDGCDGSCGDCGDGMACDPAGQCIAESTCTQVMAVAGTLTGANPYQVDLMPIGGADQDVVQLEFYADDTGAFDLAAGLNANYATCNQCVRVFEDVFPDQSDVARQYFQSEGTLTIDASSAPQTGGTVTATLDGVKLVEVTVAGDFTSTPVVDGGCIEFVDGTVLSTETACVPDCTGKACGSDGCTGSCGGCGVGQTCEAGQCIAGPGQSCASPADCTNPAADACDVGTQTCSDGAQCAVDTDCGADKRCLLQVEGGTAAACYDACSPLDDQCGAGFECVQLGFDPLAGYCSNEGAATADTACTAGPVTTGCVEGYACVDESGGGMPVCQETCSIFEVAPGCPADQTCLPGGVCVTEGVGDPAAIGAACTEATGTFCGDDGEKLAGACDEVGICATVCLLADPVCPGVELCTDVFGLAIGLCQ